MKIHHRPSVLFLVFIMFGAILLVSCSSTPTSLTKSETSAADTKPTGSLVVAGDFVVANLDPKLSSPNTHQIIGAAVFDSLIELTPDAQFRPGIAERWEISPDGKTHTFFIRKGVKFHDGSDLTGADVKFSLERIMDTDSTHIDTATWRSLIAGVDLKDDFTVAVRLKQPQFTLIKGFSDFGGSQAIVPKKYIEEKGQDYFRRNPIGSGPWKVVKYEQGNRLDLEAVESHWRAVPKFKNITLLNTPDEATKVAMLKTGELDISSVSPDAAASLKAAGLRIMIHAGGVQFYLWPIYDMEHPEQYALSNVKVRKALSLAINRQEIVDKLFSGYGQPSVMFDAVPTAEFWDTNLLKVDPFDPEGAKRLVAEAGYPNGFETSLWDAPQGNNLGQVNLALAGYWRKAGINATLTPIELNAALGAFFPKHTPTAFNKIWSYSIGGGTFQFEKMARSYHSKLGYPKNIRNPKLDEIIEKVPVTADVNERKKLALEAAVMAKNEYTAISVVDGNTLFVLGSKIGELKPIKNVLGLAASLETITHGK